MRSEGQTMSFIGATGHVPLPKGKVKIRPRTRPTGFEWPERIAEELSEVLEVKNVGRQECAETGCTNRVQRNGLCHRHAILAANAGKICKLEGCGEPVRARGMCSPHYWRELNHERKQRKEAERKLAELRERQAKRNEN